MRENLQLMQSFNLLSRDIKNTTVKKLSYELLQEYEKIDLKKEKYTLQSLISWKGINPVFKRIGRSATHILKSPIPVSGTEKYIRALKIKGVGAKINSNQIIQPTNISVENLNPHWGIGKHGEFFPITSLPAPIGSITISRAKREFDIAKHLFNNHCPSILPVQVSQYTDSHMCFSSYKHDVPEFLGVVVTGFLDEYCLRADSIFNYYSLPKEQKAIIDRWSSTLKIKEDENKQIALISAISKLYGMTIRKFSESGLYRYSGAPDNYSYSLETKEVFLIDLDSVCYLSSLNNSNVINLEVIRDAASGIAYLLAFFTNPKLLHLFPEKSVIDFNPFRELLTGYYNEIDDSYIDNISQVILSYYKNIRQKSSKIGKQIVTEINTPHSIEDFRKYLSNSYMRPWISRGNTFSYLIPLCWLLHQKSELNDKYKSSLKLQDLLENINNLSKKHKNFVSPGIVEQIKNDISFFI